MLQADGRQACPTHKKEAEAAKEQALPASRISRSKGSGGRQVCSLLLRGKFEEALIEMGIEYHRIRVATPRHNGKVERQHRTDELRFYKHMRMYNLADGRKQLAVYQRESNNHIMTCLGMKSPNQILKVYHGVM